MLSSFFIQGYNIDGYIRMTYGGKQMRIFVSIGR